MELETYCQPLVGSSLADYQTEFDVYYKDEISKLKLSDYKGKWFVLFFYPADFTFVCPTELEELANTYDSFKKLDTEIISVSTDTAFVHKAWHDNSSAINKVQFPMLADPAGKLSRHLGVYLEDDGLALRGTFVCDPDGKIVTQEVHDNSIGRSAEELLRKLQAAQFIRANKGTKVCPAAWHPGSATLEPGVGLVGKI